MKQQQYKRKLDSNGNAILDANGDYINELVSEIDLPEIELTTNQKLNNDLVFCKHLIDTFLIDNRDLPIAFTPTISLVLLQSFAPIKALAEVGDVKSVYALMQGITADTVFTQERKDKYLLMINNYLGL